MKLRKGLWRITSEGLVLSVWLICGALPAVAGHQADRDRDQLYDTVTERDITNVVLSEVLFGDHDRRILDDYLRTERYEAPQQKRKKLPPGLRKKLARDGQLPPGWQKKMARWEVMDDDIYRQSTRLPEHIARQLSDSPTGTSIRRIEDRIVRVMDATHTILDVLSAGSRDY